MLALPITVVVIYTLIVLGIAYYAWRQSGEGTEDFFLGGRQLKWFVLAWTMIATNFTSWTLIGLPSFYYTHGVAFWPLILLWSSLHMLISWFLGQRLWLVGKKMGHVTPADVLGDYYQSEWFRLLISVITIVFLFVMVVLQLIGVGIALQGLLLKTVSYPVAVAMGVGLTMIYVTVGGLRSVALTDVLQGIWFSVLLLVAAVVSLRAIPNVGFTNFFQSLEAPFLTAPGAVAGLGLSGFFMWFLVQAFGTANQPYHFQRYLMARDLGELRKALMLFIPAFIWLITPAIFIGLSVKMAMPGLNPKQAEDAVFAFIGQQSSLIAAFYAVAAIAGTMSSSDSILLSVSSFITRDIYERTILRGQKVTAHAATVIGRTVVVVLSVLAFFGAITRPGPIVTLALIPIGVFALLIFPMFGVIFWKRVGKLAGIGSFLIGFGTNVIFNYFVKPPFLNGHLLGILVAAVALIILAQIGRPMPEDVQDKYHGYYSRALPME